ncbi:Cyclic nucleotide-binding protein [Pseudocohnilembus persalinus]|uniref:Cyclic nucleotide-binding protein n=1 Tax=Pseudocohnilembus persalinus TaxID=266149 RepID=A0A0V0QTR4_PSEPJ|nr:Cyclic nucleotide-binding protein [Pseudocohnilembus persalinus]|eukprot:KRX05679.1 Cyclic nucleotide-binding protein [Pseudocohnilembus persalinus]
MEIYDQLLQYMKHESHQQNSVVFPIDSTAHKFYIILQGQVSVHIRSKNFASQQLGQSQIVQKISKDNDNDNNNNNEENQDKNNNQTIENNIQNIKSQQNSNIQCDKDGNELFCVKILEEGDFFGEQAFISNKKRLATIVCETSCHFAVLSKIHFKDILLKAEEKKFMQELSFLTTKYIFKDWNFSILKALYLQFTEKQCHMNQIIFQEGDQCDYIYIIKQGDFVIKKKSYNQEFEEAKSLFYENDLLSNKKLKPNYQKPANLKLQLISAIDIFGEEDYLKNTKRSYTVECLSNNGILMQLRYEDFNGMIYRDQITKKKVDLRVKQKEKRIKERMEIIEKNIKGLENFYYDPTLNSKIQNVDILKQINGQLSIDDLQLLQFFKNPNLYKVSEEEQKKHDKLRQINQQQIYFNQEAKLNSMVIKNQKELINQVNSSKIQLSGQGKNSLKQRQQNGFVQSEHENNVKLDEKKYQNNQLNISKNDNNKIVSSKFTNFSQNKRYQTQTEASNRNFSTNSSIQQKNYSQLQGSKTQIHNFKFQRIQSAKIQPSKFKQNHINSNQSLKNLKQFAISKFQNLNKNINESNNLIEKNQTTRTLQSDFNDDKSKQNQNLNNSGDQILEFSQNNSQQKGLESKRSHQSQNSNNTLRLNKETKKKIEQMQKQPFYINLSSSNSPKSTQIKQNKTEHGKSVFTFSGVNDFIERQLNKQVQNKICRIKELKQKQKKFFTRPQSTKATYNKKCITNTSQKEQQSILYQNELLTLNDQISSTYNTQLYQEMYNQKNSYQYNNSDNFQDNIQSQNKSNKQTGYKYNAKDRFSTQSQENFNKQDEINENYKKYEIFLKQLYYERFRNDNSNVDQLKQVIGTDIINSLKYEPAPSVNQRQKNGAPSLNLPEERKIYLRLKNKIELPFKKNSLQEKFQQYDYIENVNDLDKNQQKFEESIMKYNSQIISQINRNIQQSQQEQNQCYDDKIQKDQSHFQNSDNVSQQILEQKNLKNINNIPQGHQATNQYQQSQQVDYQCENGRVVENETPQINNYEEIGYSPKSQVDNYNYIEQQQFQSQKKQNSHKERKNTNFSIAIRPLSSYVYNYNTPKHNQRILESQMEAEDYDKLDKKNIEKNYKTAQYFDQLQNEQSFKKIKNNRDYMTEANAKQKNLKIQIEQMSKVFQTMNQENQQKNIYLSNTCQNSQWPQINQATNRLTDTVNTYIQQKIKHSKRKLAPIIMILATVHKYNGKKLLKTKIILKMSQKNKTDHKIY